MNVELTTLAAGAACYGVDPESFKPLGGMDGAVFACRKNSRAFAIKFTPMEVEKLPEYEEKLAFVLYLAQGGVPLAAPLESQQGRHFEVVTEGERQFVVTLMPLADGRHPQPRNLYDWNDHLFQLWGAVMGKMHALAKAYPKWRRPLLSTPEDEAYSTRIIDWQGELRFFTDWCKEPKVVEKWEAMGETLALLPIDRDGYGLVHNDLHNWNFMYNPDARGVSPITIIDFDVCAYHWFISDIAIPVYHSMSWGKRKTLPERERFVRQFMSQFMRGYAAENHLDAAWLERLPTFLKYRELLFYTVFSNEWPEGKRARWQTNLLTEKRSRILRDEPIITCL